MNKAAAFIVRKRKLVMAVMLIIAVICAVLSSMVNINEDMTKYLPDDSAMKQGMDVMSEEFPDVETDQTIRVMVQGLNDSQKSEVLAALKALEYTDSVDYDDSEDYNKDGYTLFKVNTVYDYGSDEETALEADIEAAVSGYTAVVKSDDTSMEGIPTYVMVAALAILLAVLFAMCGSWIEPLLFLVTIGIAVVINSGTNYFLGSVSSVTNMIAALLQLVLSMDYSIILMNRYRQELEHTSDRSEAMSAALGNAFTSITGSSVTTIVGLLALVFMSFKIGMDLGIVLAKGVLISMLCVFTVLPGLILFCSKAVEKTAKKVPHIPMGGLGSFSHKCSIPVTIVFVLLFAGSFIMQSRTQTAFTLEEEDPIAEIFPKTNAIVLVYENSDDEAVTEIAEQLADSNDNVKAAASYSTTLGKPYTAEELAEQLGEMSDDLDLEPEFLKILYYDKYCSDTDIRMTVSEFLNFVRENVLTNDMFADRIDDDMRDKAELIAEFADAGNLTKKKSAEELADTFGIDADMIQKMMLLYYSENGKADTGTMTLPVFAEFITNEVLQDPDYSSAFDSDTMDMMDTLLTFTDKKKMTEPLSCEETAALLGMDADTARLLYVYYYASSESYDAGTMTMAEFTSFVQQLSSNGSAFGGYIDENMLGQITMLGAFTDKESIQSQKTSEELSAMFGLDKAMTDQIFMAAIPAESPVQTMSAVQFVDLLVNNMSSMLDQATLGKLRLIQNIMNGVIADKAYTCTEISYVFGAESSTMKMLYTLRNSMVSTADWKLSVQTVVDFLVSNKEQLASVMGDNADKLSMLQMLIDSSVNDTEYTPEELSAMLGTDSSQLRQLYLLYRLEQGNTDDWKLSISEFITFIRESILTDESYAEQFDSDSAELMTAADTIISAVLSGEEYDLDGLTRLFGGMTDEMDNNTMQLFALYYGSCQNYDPSWTMTIHQMFGFIADELLNDPRFEAVIDNDMRDTITENRSTIDDGIAQLKGDDHSRLILSTVYSDESAETSEFIGELTGLLDEKLNGEHYLIGSSVMNYEMENSFDDEMLLITLITAISIFVVVAITFRSLIIPLILVLIVQCGVFVTVTIIGIQGYSIYYLALLIVQSILMGATIDYGILYTNYYLEKRRTQPVREALTSAYEGAIHTILTSGLILILVTGIVGNLFSNPTVGQICRTISMGALSASLLILFILPGMLAAFDKLIIRKHKVRNSE